MNNVLTIFLIAGSYTRTKEQRKLASLKRNIAGLKLFQLNTLTTRLTLRYYYTIV